MGADAGASAWDNLNRNVNTKIVKTITFKGKTVSKVDTSKTGVYTITYNVKDASGNKAVAAKRTVTVIDTLARVQASAQKLFLQFVVRHPFVRASGPEKLPPRRGVVGN